MNLPQIAQGWYNFAQGSAEIKQMMHQRLQHCEQCPHKVMLSSSGQRLVRLIDAQATVFKCGLCGCPLAGKTAAREASCPDNPSKWGPHQSSPSYY